LSKIKVAAVGGSRRCAALVQGVQDFSTASEVAQKWFYEFIAGKQDRWFPRLILWR